MTLASISQQFYGGLSNWYDGEQGSCSVEVGARIGFLCNGAACPVVSIIDGICSVFVNGMVLLGCTTDGERGEWITTAQDQSASFARIIANIYMNFLKCLNPAAQITDLDRLERDWELNSHKAYDCTGDISIEVKFVFDKIIFFHCQSNAFNREITSRFLVICKTALVALAHILDMVVGAIAALASIVTYASFPGINTLAYNSLKIGALLGDFYDLCTQLYDPASIGRANIIQLPQ